MNDSIGKLFVIVLGAFLMVFFPLIQMLENQEDISRMFVQTEAGRFVDAVRNTGYITPRMYQDFLTALASSGMLFEIELEHLHRKYDPVYVDPLESNSFTGEVKVNYNAFYTEDILMELTEEDAKERYVLSKGDYFTVNISNREKTLATKTKELFLGSDFPVETIIVRYGGMVH